MRNVPFTSNVGGCELIGIVKNGKKFPFGTVSEETYNADMADVTERIQNVGEVAEHAVNSVAELSASVESLRTTLGARIDNLTDTERADIANVYQLINSTVNTLNSAINEVNADIADITARHSTDVNALNMRIDTVNSTVSEARIDIADLRGDVEGLSNTVDVRFDAVNRRIDEITGDDTFEIISFTASPNICEIGGVENIILNWEIQGIGYSVTINGDPVTGTSLTVPNVNEPITFTMVVTDWQNRILTKSIRIDFVNHVFWGASVTDNPDEGTVKSLDYTSLSDDRRRIFNVTVNDEYIYYSYPKRLGTSEFEINGFVGGFEDPTIIAIDNHSEYEEDYYVYRSANKISGTFTVHVI